MTKNILLATLGERPAAITMVLDALLPQYQYEQLVLLHTDAQRSAISQPLLDLEEELARHRPYKDLSSQRWEMRGADGLAIVDTNSQGDAEAYFRALVACFRHFREEGYNVHVLISGGRKAMSAYAVVAASYVLAYEDRLWTSTVERQHIGGNIWHLAPGEERALSVVNLPFKASRLTRGQLQDVSFTDLVWNASGNVLQRLLEEFTEREREVARMICNHPYDTDARLSELLGIGQKTMETHLRNMYSKTDPYWRLPKSNRRAFLRDVLEGRM